MPPAPPRPTYWLTRFVILRLLGVVYLAAFLSAAIQLVPLIGHDGLLPAHTYLERIARGLGSPQAAFTQLPTVFWYDVSDRALVAVAWAGAALAFVVVCGYANAVIMGVLWALYFSIVAVGQDWYGYGWEIQLLETGAIAVFLCPLLDPRPFPRRPPPFVAILLFRWLAFRIMLGAGLIKIRGDACWRDLTCLAHHYETQPIPNPLSRAFHFMPLWFHKAGVLFNHLVELVSPWFIFGPRLARRAAGLLMILFQVILILSGNLSFLNYVTIVPALAALDDDLLRRLLPRFITRRARRAAESWEDEVTMRERRAGVAPAPPDPDAFMRAAPSEAHVASDSAPIPAPRRPWRPADLIPRRPGEVFAALYAVVVAVLSLNVVTNLVSSRQIMNTSFDRLHLVNTYGAFGSVGKERHEIVFEGTRDDPPTPQTRWLEYDFWCKPGTPTRRPCIIAPLQPRLDWQIWFAAMSRPDRYPWTTHLVWKLLHNDPGALSLLSTNPFPDVPPRYIRAAYYRYEFARSGWSPPAVPRPGSGDAPGDVPAGTDPTHPAPTRYWWNRTYLGEWLPPLSVDDPRLLRVLRGYGWIGGGAAGARPAPAARPRP